MTDHRFRITDNGVNVRITSDAVRLMHPGFRHAEKGIRRIAYGVKQRQQVLAQFILIIILTMIACRSISKYQEIRDGDFTLVAKGKYRGKLNYLSPGNEYAEATETLVRIIEKNGDVLPLITRHYFTVAESLPYKFMHSSVDQEQNVLVLRYFARVMAHSLYAGYQIQFVFNVSAKKLIQIFTTEVPLE